MKRRLAQTALTQPEFALTGQESVAEDLRIGARADSLGKAAVVSYQHRLDFVRMGEEVA